MKVKYLPFLGSDVKESSFENSFFHFIPVPLEKSVSYGKGAGLGPAAILKASWELETFDFLSNPSELGLYTHKPINCSVSIDRVYEQIDKTIKSIIKNKSFPVILGGEHTVTSLVVKSVHNYISDFGVVHFDAHADLKESYQNNIYSHACALKRVFDLGVPIVQFGIRSLTKEEYDFRKENNILSYDASFFFGKKVFDVKLPDNFPERVYITIDVDVFDPSIIPATGTPEPGGLLWYQVIDILSNIIKDREVVGFDVVELAPIKGIHHPDFTAAKLVYTLMGLIQRKMKS